MKFNSSYTKQSLSFLLLIIFFSFAYIGISKTLVPISAKPHARTANIISAVKQGALQQNRNPIFMIGIPDLILSKKTAEFISDNHIGGILLLSRNIQSEEQVKKLTTDIHSLNPNIIIAIDQEGGEISRITFPGNELTPQKNIKTEADAYVVARKRAERLKSYGIDMNFSPVVDFITNKDSFLYERTFQKDLEMISILAGAMLRGYEDGGITPVLKHFPGHTNDSSDTHYSTAVVFASKNELARHILPFKKTIERFNPPAVMVGGSTYSAYDSVPAALSPIIIKNLLRGELTYKGIVISDDLEMDAFSEYSLNDRARMALEAGCDVVIFSQTKTTQEELIRVLTSITDAKRK